MRRRCAVAMHGIGRNQICDVGEGSDLAANAYAPFPTIGDQVVMNPVSAAAHCALDFAGLHRDAVEFCLPNDGPFND